jgi:hypothetical protein
MSVTLEAQLHSLPQIGQFTGNLNRRSVMAVVVFAEISILGNGKCRQFAGFCQELAAEIFGAGACQPSRWLCSYDLKTMTTGDSHGFRR